MPSVLLRDLSPDAVGRMPRADLAHATEEPPSAIDTIDFHGCGCGVGAIVGRSSPCRSRGSASRSACTPARSSSCPGGTWHGNDAPDGVTMLYMTPLEGNELSWEDPPVEPR